MILEFTENDVDDLAGTSTWDELAANRKLKSRFPLSILYPILRRTALWNFALRVRAVREARGAKTAPVATPDPAVRDSAVARLRRQYGDKLLALRDSLAALDLPLLFVVFPSHHALVDGSKRDQVQWITTLAREAGIRVVDLLPPFIATGLSTDQLYLLPWDGHPSSRGYAIAAAELAPHVAADSTFRHRCQHAP